MDLSSNPGNPGYLSPRNETPGSTNGPPEVHRVTKSPDGSPEVMDRPVSEQPKATEHPPPGRYRDFTASRRSRQPSLAG